MDWDGLLDYVAAPRFSEPFPAAAEARLQSPNKE